MATKTKKKKTVAAGQGRAPLPRAKGISRRAELWLLGAVLGVAIIARLFFITSPLMDFHSERQTQTAAITRNFYQTDANIFTPRFIYVEMRGREAPGVTGMEFPVYQYIVSLAYRVFGAHDYIGRLFSLIFGVGAIYYAYLLVKKYYGARAALLAGAFFALNPAAVFFTRTFQPDPMALFSLVAGLYYLLDWFDTQAAASLTRAALFMALSLLIKPPYIVVLAPIVLYKFVEGRLWAPERRRDLGLSAAVGGAVIAVVLAWFYYSFTYTFGKTGLTVARGSYPTQIYKTWEFWLAPQFYWEALKRIWILLTPFGTLLFAAGLVIAAKNKKWLPVIAFGGYLLYFVGVAEYNWPHYYYQLPLIPVAALAIGALGKACFDWMDKESQDTRFFGYLGIAVSVLLLAGLSYQTARPWYEINGFAYAAATGEIKDYVEPHSVVVAPGVESYYYLDAYYPYVIYDKKLDGPRFVANFDEYMKLGTKYFIWFKSGELNPATRAEYDKYGDLIADKQLFAVWKAKKKYLKEIPKVGNN